MIWHVDPKTGNDGNDGRSAASPFKTLAHAIGSAKSGDTLMMAPGLYGQDLPQQVSAARARGLTIGVAGSE